MLRDLTCYFFRKVIGDRGITSYSLLPVLKIKTLSLVVENLSEGVDYEGVNITLYTFADYGPYSCGISADHFCSKTLEGIAGIKYDLAFLFYYIYLI